MRQRIKIFFVTYKEPTLLNETLESFFETGGSELCDEVTIINNHSDFYLKNEFLDKVKVIHNSARPDFSTGHLSRNWNQCILHGFKNLKNPDCDILICCQNDVKFINGWTSKIKGIHSVLKLDFFATGAGDCFCSYTPKCIEEVGLWDERFCGIGFQEADYFNRASFHLRERCSINDFGHGRVLNALATNSTQDGFEAYEKIGVCYKSNHGQGQTEPHKLSGLYGHEPSLGVFTNKFKPEVTINDLKLSNYYGTIGETIYSGNLKNSMLYPYFECGIAERHLKNYMN